MANMQRKPNAIPGGAKMPLDRRNAGAKDFGTEGNISESTGTSIFDPVLCEVVYSWFSPVGASVLDPFAGGSVRGVVAAKLGRQYTGIDLRQEQISANIEQWNDITGVDALDDNITPPLWIAGDSTACDKLLAGNNGYDLLFSCPPYGDLEVYSEDPDDLSSMEYDEFKRKYFDIINKSCAALRQDSFACFVVGDFRDRRGMYRNFVSHTIEGFLSAGLELYNEIIYLTPLGSLPIRAGRPFKGSRKVGKTHQNVLVFVKGDPKKATLKCGDIEIIDMQEDVE